MSRLHPFLACFVAALALAACDSKPTDAASGGSDASGGGDASGGNGNAPPEYCPEGDNPESEGELSDVGLVTALIVDEQGDPTSAGLVQVCAKNVCLDATPGSNGRVSQQGGSMLIPATKIGDGREWGKLAIPIGAGDIDLGTLTAVRLPDFSEGVFLTPGEAASSGGVTLSVASSGLVELDIFAFEDDSLYTFRARELPDAALHELTEEFVTVFALAPLETVICPPPALSIENSKGLAAGSELELYIQGLDVSEKWAPYSGWQKVSEGQVSDDGATLEFEVGPPVLTLIGIREKG